MKLKLIQDALRHQDTVLRNDADLSLAFARELEYIYTETYNFVYPDNVGRSLVPVDYRVPPGANSHTYRQFKDLGQATKIHDYANDFPMVTREGQEFKTGIFSIGNSYGYSVQDLRSAAMVGLSLDADLAFAARSAMERKLDALICLGDSETGITGLANAPNIIQTTGAGSWASASADDMVADIKEMWQNIVTTNIGTAMPDTLVMGTTAYTQFTTKRLDAYNLLTVAEYILSQKSLGIKNLVHWPRLETADGSGGPRILMYKKDPRMLKCVIPQEFEQFEPQKEGMMWKIPCHMRFAGVTVHYPKSISYCDTIG